MALETLLKLLDEVESGKKTINEIVDLPCSRTIFEAMAVHPEETRTYMRERQNIRFQNRTDISAHTQKFADAIGVPVSQVTGATHQLGVYSRRTQESLEREAVIDATYQQRLKQLKAAVDVIQGYGTVAQLAEDYGISNKALYNHTNKQLALNGLEIKGLREMSIPNRKALGDKVRREGEAKLAEYYQAKMKGDGEYRKT